MNGLIVIVLAVLAFVWLGLFTVSACALSSRITRISEQGPPTTEMEKH